MGLHKGYDPHCAEIAALMRSAQGNFDLFSMLNH